MVFFVSKMGNQVVFSKLILKPQNLVLKYILFEFFVSKMGNQLVFGKYNVFACLVVGPSKRSVLGCVCRFLVFGFPLMFVLFVRFRCDPPRF